MSEVAPAPTLVVDDRQDNRFTAALRQYFDVHVKHLKCGDLVWSCPLGTVGVEDKSLRTGDLANSQQNKRLDDELRRLVDTYSIPVLFIRGEVDRRGDPITVQNTLFGRQLHGVYTFMAPKDFDGAAEALWRLHRYLALPRNGGNDGVRRERVLSFGGPIGPRADVIYGILGMAGGVRDRRSIAQSIAQTTPLSAFLRWDAWDFEAQGFTRHMASKLSGVLKLLEEPPSKSLTQSQPS